MATKTFAILDGANVVTNIIKWDGVTEYKVDPGSVSRDITDLKDVGIGYKFNGTTYDAPPAPDPEPPSQAQILEDRVVDLEKWRAFITPKLDAAGIK